MGGAGLLGISPALAQSPLQVAQFALALERLEAVFYEQAVLFLQKQAPGRFFSASYSATLLRITNIVRIHERTHEVALDTSSGVRDKCPWGGVRITLPLPLPASEPSSG